MAELQVQKLIFDIITSTKEKALDIQNRISALTDTTTVCLEKALEKHDTTENTIVIDSLTLDVGNVNYELLEEELLQKLQKALHLKMNTLSAEYTYENRTPKNRQEVVVTRANYINNEKETIGDKTLSSQKQFTHEDVTEESYQQNEKKLEHDRSDSIISYNEISILFNEIIKSGKNSDVIVESVNKNLVRRVLYFLVYGVSPDSKTVTAEDIEKCFYIGELSLWLSHNSIKENPVLQRVVSHFTHTKLYTLFDLRKIFTKELFDEFILLLEHSVDTLNEQLTFDFWEYIINCKARISQENVYSNLIKWIVEKSFAITNKTTPQKISHRLYRELATSMGYGDIVSLNYIEIACSLGTIIVTSTKEQPPEITVSLEKTIWKNESAVIHHEFSKKRNSSQSNSTLSDDTITIKNNNDTMGEKLLNNTASTVEEEIHSANQSINEHNDNLSVLFDNKRSPENGDVYYINNGGLILTATFLGYFFKGIEYIEKGKFISEEKQKQAVILLQKLCGDEFFSEDQMVLSKILCGLSIYDTVPMLYIPTEKESEELNLMVDSLIHYWPVLKNTSVEAFKYNYMKRTAMLTYGEKQWNLRIKRESIDVIIDTLPWSIGLTKQPWMEKAIITEW